jgi:hypothetical protein
MVISELIRVFHDPDFLFQPCFLLRAKGKRRDNTLDGENREEVLQ